MKSSSSEKINMSNIQIEINPKVTRERKTWKQQSHFPTIVSNQLSDKEKHKNI